MQNVLRFVTPGAGSPDAGHRQGWQTSEEQRSRHRWRRVQRALAVSGIVVLMMVGAAQIAERSEWLALPPTDATRVLAYGPRALKASGPAALQPLAFVHPARLLERAGDCLVLAAGVSDCKLALARAVEANRRATRAALWIAQIASFEGDDALAEAWYAYSFEVDGSFPVLWAWANSGLATDESFGHTGSAPDRTAVARKLPRGAVLDQQLLLQAPPDFEAHIPLLLGKGWMAEDLYGRLATEGRPAQTATLLRYLLRSGHADGVQLVERTLEASTALPGLRQMPCGELARGVLTMTLREREAATRPELDQATRVWNKAIQGRRATCDVTEARQLPDKRLHLMQDPAWNYNPALRLPMVPESFDWSVLALPGSHVSRLSDHGGLRVALEAPFAGPLVVLSRPLPPQADNVQAQPKAGIEVKVQWQQHPPSDCAKAWRWELRAPDGRQRFSQAPIPVQENRDESKAEDSSQIPSEARYFLTTPEESVAMQLLLVFAPRSGDVCGQQSLSLRQIEVARTDLPSGAEPH